MIFISKKMSSEAPSLHFNTAQVEDSIGYLLSRSKTMLSRSVDEALRRLEISHSQSSVIMMLCLGKCSTAAELARDLFIDSAAMKRTLDKLEAKDYIRRVSDPGDKRLFKIELSAQGKQLAAQLPPIYREVLDVSFTGFTQEELGFLKCLLRKLLANRALLEAKDFSCPGN
jgi:DNA-binding MarR family transcriptional regulator